MNIKDVDLNLLTVFHAIYEARSISAAAKQLDLSQPGMSHALKRLRTQLNDKLFVRKGNGVEPTVYADSIAEPIRNAISFLEISLSPDKGFDPATSTRHFRLMMADFVEPLILPTLMEATYANPNVTFELLPHHSTLIEDAILQGSIDLSVHLQSDMMFEISADPLFPLSVMPTYRLGHPITQEPNIIAALGKYRMISPNMKPGAVKNLSKAKIDQNVTREFFCLVHSIRSIPALLADSDCISFLPKLYLMNVAEKYGLGYAPLPMELVKQDITLNWHRRNDNDSALMWLRKCIKDRIAELTARANEHLM